MTLQKDDFITKFAEKGYTKRDAAVVFDDFIDTITEALVRGDDVAFRGFGTFKVKDRAPRTCINPSDKKIIQIPAFKGVQFTAGASLKRVINAD